MRLSTLALLAVPPVLRRKKSPQSCVPLRALSPSLMDPIVRHPALSALSLDLRPRSRLKERHVRLFDGPTADTALFDALAAVACRTGVVCRKELFETYAAATFIHAKFPHVRRIADLAAGHGLLAWFLLVLDGATGARPRTAVCVDRRMPPAAEAIAAAMVGRWPELAARWTYVQADLDAAVPDPTCLLVSVHACGPLSDRLLAMAMEGGAGGSSFAIVPCCHTVRERKGYRPHPLAGMDAGEVAALVEERKERQGDAKHEAVADVVDEVRCRTLENAGYDVEVVLLPAAFTARNRLLLGAPTGARPDPGGRPHGGPGRGDREFFRRRPGEAGTPPSPLRIPLADDPASIARCRALSGKARAVTRLIEKIPRHFTPVRDISIWLPEAGDAAPTLATLQALADRCCGEHGAEDIRCTVDTFGEAYVQPATGRRSQLYRFTYRKPEATEPSTAGVSRASAKAIHGAIREKIIERFGDLIR